ncbi:MAG: efflux RND transporter permease subunit, partial [Paracoccaceae bacterium]
VTVFGDIAEDDPDRAALIDRTLTSEIIPAVEATHSVATRLSGSAAEEAEFLGGALQGLILALIGIYLCLSWIFESWTRPFVIMAVIPFGLVGAIFGHWHWDIPMSMFSIVGMIGMSGIIINDAIVLVTTADEYAEQRGARPAIIDAVADRFRPVLLTTTTTVIGLVPLLYEGSSQAEFLKPTIVTLAYGLGFGMFLVLLVVPSILAVQVDIGQHLRAGRRGLRRRGPRQLIGAAVAASLVLFAVIMGPVLITGALPAMLGGGGAGAALGLYLALVALICTIIWITGRIMLRPRRAQPLSRAG